MRVSNRLLSLTLATMVGATAGLPLEVTADDTEIYLGDDALSEGILPNVLFILDTSGSMSAYDGHSSDRMDRMKAALDQILDQTNNVNVGLMRFTDPGGPILFPVADINADADAVENAGQADVSVLITDPNDDAEEKGGSVLLDSSQLDLVYTDAFGSEISIAVPVIDGADDAEQTPSWMNNSSSTMEMTDTGGGSNRTNGIRFQNVFIEPGDKVLAATIDFRSLDDRSSNADLTVKGHYIGDSPSFPSSAGPGDPYDRLDELTAATLDWADVEDWIAFDRHFSPDLSAIVSEIASHPSWASGNAMTFIFTGTAGSLRNVSTRDRSSVDAPVLRVSLADRNASTGDQQVGLRFREIRVPQGVTITSAKIEFTAAQTDTTATDLTIYGEAAASASAFTTAVNDVSRRTRTSASVAWSVEPWDTVNAVEQTPDLTSIVQEIVNRSDWCGGQDMAFIIERHANTGTRRSHSADGDPSRAPVLRIEYDERSSLLPGQGCISQELQVQVAGSKDDAEQIGHRIFLGSSRMEMFTDGSGTRTNGIRFRNLDIDSGAEIVSAKISFRADRSDSGGTTIRFRAHDVGDSPKFRGGYPDRVNDRETTSASVTWNILETEPWSTGTWYESPELKPVLDEIMARSDWQAGNDVSFILSGSGLRRASTYNRNPSYGAILKVTTKGYLAQDTNTSLTTVRERLKEVVSDLGHSGYTPIVDTLYEASRYFRGQEVYYGKTRGDGGSTVERNTRVSHPASYTGGAVSRPSGCEETNLSANECRNEEITGTPIYTSPIVEACQANYIVLLTDGFANHNHSQDEIQTLIGESCIGDFSSGESISSGEKCGLDIVRWMYETDVLDSIDGDNTITTYTIGFNISNDFLKEMALVGGGSFYEAETSAELAAVFQTIIADVLSRTTSFAAPSLSVNAFNKLFHRNEVYFSLFKPTEEVRWDGNVKKYQLCEDPDADSCELGEILDAREPPAGPLPAIGDDNRIRDDALSFWSQAVDGAEILLGGAGSVMPAHSSRIIYTYTDSAVPNSVDLGLGDYALSPGNSALTKEMLGGSNDPAATNYMTDQERIDLIDWIRGKDVDDADADSDVDEDRYLLADPLHSSPVAVTYGCEHSDHDTSKCDDDETPVIKLFVGTNDGALRMLNANTGEEEWAFYPQEMLDDQAELRGNPNGSHIYGLDLTPTIWVNDEDYNGIIDPSVDADGDGTKEFVRVYIGMRRGGDSLFAFDVTPSTGHGPLNDPDELDGVQPTLLWRIDGSSTAFPRLGQTWSQPSLMRIGYGTTTEGQYQSKYVLAFAGGYDEAQDLAFESGGLGNAIYIVDPDDGSALFWVSSDGSAAHTIGEGVEVSGMNYPIPSQLTVMDSNSDTLVDRIYVGDTGGQLWRVDLKPDTSASAGIKATVGLIATVSDTAALPDQRKFFYPPDVVQVREEQYSSIGNYDLLTIVSGDRANPLETSVQNRFYAIRDLYIDGLTDGDPAVPGDEDGLADGLATVEGKTEARSGDLLDLTLVNGVSSDNLAEMLVRKGYFIDFEVDGEKGLSKPVILDGKVFFTTYLPGETAAGAACSLAEGSGQLYGIDVLTGEAAYEWDETDPARNVNDRTHTLGAGIPSSAVPIFQEKGITLLIGGGGGATTVDPDIGLPRTRTYWFNQTN